MICSRKLNPVHAHRRAKRERIGMRACGDSRSGGSMARGWDPADGVGPISKSPTHAHRDCARHARFRACMRERMHSRMPTHSVPVGAHEASLPTALHRPGISCHSSRAPALCAPRRMPRRGVPAQTRSMRMRRTHMRMRIVRSPCTRMGADGRACMPVTCA